MWKGVGLGISSKGHSQSPVRAGVSRSKRHDGATAIPGGPRGVALWSQSSTSISGIILEIQFQNGTLSGPSGYEDLTVVLSRHAFAPASEPLTGPKRPHNHEDPTNHRFWNFPCLGLERQRSVCLCSIWGPSLNLNLAWGPVGTSRVRQRRRDNLSRRSSDLLMPSLVSQSHVGDSSKSPK